MKVKDFAFLGCFIVIVSLVKCDENLDRSRSVINENSCGLADTNIETNYIHNGQCPFIAAIFHIIDEQVHFICGGTIVSNYVVITGITNDIEC